MKKNSDEADGKAREQQRELQRELAARATADANAEEEHWPTPSDPVGVAWEFLERYRRGDVFTLRSWRGSWVKWERGVWSVTEDDEIREELYKALATGTYLGKDGVARWWYPTRRKIADVEHAMKAITRLSETAEPGDWIGDAGEATATSELVSVENGILHIPTRKLTKHNPDLFNLVQVPFEYVSDALTPDRWVKFLEELWPDDPSSALALQEWFGYVVSGRTDLHKMFLLIGPTRAGKSVLARVLGALVGRDSVVWPSLAAVGTNFGLQPLIGKALAIIPDARLGRGASQIVERLLTISGEDGITVDRKYKEPWTGQMTARFMIISNEIPRFGDASGAIAKRFVLLTLRQDWLGREDTSLADELLTELGGIFKWALDGLDRLTGNGAFEEPAASREAISTMEDLTSPVAAFARDRCNLGHRYEIPVKDLFAAWKDWCGRNENNPGTTAIFGRNLSAAFPAIRRTRPSGEGRRPYVYQGVALDPQTELPGSITTDR